MGTKGYHYCDDYQFSGERKGNYIPRFFLKFDMYPCLVCIILIWSSIVKIALYENISGLEKEYHHSVFIFILTQILQMLTLSVFAVSPRYLVDLTIYSYL